MAILTKPTISKGQANEIDLSKSDLAAVSKVVNDSYFSDQTNWSKVIVEYKSAEGNQHEMVIFDATGDSPKGNFEVSEKAKDSWEVQSVKIMDFDGGYLKLGRGDLTVEDFDIALGSVGGDIIGFGVKSVDNTSTNYGYVDYSGYAISTGNVTASFWFKGDTVNDQFLAGFNRFGAFGITSDGNIFVREEGGGVHTTQTNENFNDGQWHNVVLYMGVNCFVSECYVDGQLFGIHNYELGTWGSIVGASFIAQVDYFTGQFNNEEVLEIFNNGFTLNPQNHSRSADLLGSYVFGDNPNDGQAFGTNNFPSIRNNINENDQGTALRIQIGNGAAPSPFTSFVNDHPDGNN